MPNYTLELELFSLLNTSTSAFEIWADGSQFSGGHTIFSSGATISVNIPYGGALPSSLQFRFVDAAPISVDQIEIRSVKINDRYVNTGNFLSSNILNDGGNSNVNITGADFIFNNSADPAASEFTIGATQTFTAGIDNFRGHNLNTDQIFNLLGGNDYAITGSGDDKISGDAGDDVIYSNGGNDLVFGDIGNDRLYGGDGNDALYGGDGDDRIHGEEGDDEIHGGAGNDTLNGHNGNDTITGGDGDDKITGADGDDILYGDAGADQITGGAGNDTIDGGDDDDLIYGGAGNDRIDGGDGVDFLIGNQGNDVINGGAQDDVILGQDGIDTLYGGTGNDRIIGGIDNDIINGGDGDDIITTSESILDQIGSLGTGNYNFLIGGTIQTLHVDFDGTDHWLLVGRGRENWQFDTDGQGTSANMTVGLGTSAAFAPIAYSDSFVNNLITATGNDLTDTEIRLKRAANITGTEYQEVRWDPITQTSFTFDFDNVNFDVGLTVSSSVLGSGFTDAVSATRDGMSTTGPDSGNNHERVWTWNWGGKASIQGFSYGSTIQGVDGNSPTSFLWERTSEAHATPYTEVYIRLNSTAVLTDTGGNDIIDGGAGNDTIIEDLGNDTIRGGTGNDVISSGQGIDTLFGDAGNDTLNGGLGNDIINGGADNDILNGDGGNDTLNGDDGLDIIKGGAGADIIDGGNDNDTILLANGDFAAGESLTGGAGIDNITLTNATTVNFSTGTITTVENLFGSDANDDVTYTLQQALGFSTINLNAGVDNSRVQVSGTVNVTALGTPVVTNAENGFLVGSGGNDDVTISGAQLSALIFGAGNINMGTGFDTINITSTSVTLNTLGLTNALIVGLETISASTAGAAVTINMSGQTEGFTLIGGNSNDIITGGSGADNINGGAGNDTIDAGNGNDTIIDISGNDAINGGGGFDTLDYSTAGTWVNVDLSVLTVQNTRMGNDIISNVENLRGSTSNDQLRGDGNNNIIYGGLGADQMWGNGGADTFYGEEGNDDFWVSGTEAYNDIFNGGADYDEIQMSADSYFNLASIFVDIERIDMNGFNAIAQLNNGLNFTGMVVTARGDILGQSGNETITGSDSSDYIYGLDGNDILSGGIGTDYVYGGNGNDTINGDVGTDRLYGGAGNDIINGGDDGDYIYGEDGADIINGGNGNDDFWVTGTEAYGDQYDGGADYDEIQFLANSYFNLSTTFINMERIDMNTFDAIAELNSGLNFTGMVVTARGNILGQGGNETITGSDSGDLIYGLAGNDTLNGGIGSDYIEGGDGDDTINGGLDNDTIYGNIGADILNGDDGDDNFYVSGTDGIGDQYDGGAGNDDFYLETDIFLSLTTTFTNMERVLFGGTPFTITAVLGSGFNLTGMTASGTSNLYGQSGDENISGTESGDQIYGGEGADILNGNGGGDNFYISGTESLGDQYNGGTGTDYIRLVADSYFNSGNSFTDMELFVFNGFNAYVTSGSTVDFSTIAKSGTGDIIGDIGNETIIGMSNANIIYGLGGDDTITGGIGTDVIYGGEGADIIFGDDGADDFYMGGTEGIGDQYDGGNSTDDIYLTSNVFLDLTTTFTNMERIVFGGFTVTSTFGTGFNLSGMSASGASLLYGQGGDEVITGTEGSDDIYGGEGADTLTGGNGNDEFFIEGTESLGDVYDGGIGVDYIRMSANSFFNSANSFVGIETLINNGFNLNLISGTTIDFSSMARNGAGEIIGAAGVETIRGFNNNDVIYGLEGADILYGDDGNDIFYVSGTESLGDQYDGGAGTDYVRLLADSYFNSANVFTDIETITFNGFNMIVDTGATVDLSGILRASGGQIHGSSGNETITGVENGVFIYGFDGNDSLRGGAGADDLYGGNGDDILYGGDALDDLYGEAGADIFVLENATAFNNIDRIRDFSTADNDKLDISDLLSSYTYGVDDLTLFVQINDSGAHSTIFVDPSGTGTFAAATQVAFMYNINGITDEIALETAGHLITH